MKAKIIKKEFMIAPFWIRWFTRHNYEYILYIKEQKGIINLQHGYCVTLPDGETK